MLAVKAECFAYRGYPQAANDGKLFFQTLKSLPLREKRNTVRSVLKFKPSGAEPKEKTPITHGIHLRCSNRHGTRQSEGCTAYQSTQPDPLGLSCQACQSNPRIGWARQAVQIPNRQKVIRSHECGKPVLFSLQGYPQLIFIIGTLRQGDKESNFQIKFLVKLFDPSVPPTNPDGESPSQCRRSFLPSPTSRSQHSARPENSVSPSSSRNSAAAWFALPHAFVTAASGARCLGSLIWLTWEGEEA